ncbi:MAG: hypothetical protein OJF50_002832 [Nitrospira sp.]|nr:hypothetical protein [Nitrospira sp.]
MDRYPDNLRRILTIHDLSAVNPAGNLRYRPTLRLRILS